MSDFDKKREKHAQLMQQSMRLSARSAPIIALAALLQEAVNLNQEFVNSLAEITEKQNNDSKSKSPDTNGGEVPGKA